MISATQVLNLFRTELRKEFERQRGHELPEGPAMSARTAMSMAEKHVIEKCTQLAMTWEREGRYELADAAQALVECIPEIAGEILRPPGYH